MARIEFERRYTSDKNFHLLAEIYQSVLNERVSVQSCLSR
jgi:hypothetical protein